MTIDEEIAHAREKAKEIRENIIDGDNLEPYESYCNAMVAKSAEEYEQLAEWLEELKELRKIKEDYSKGMQTAYATFMYNKALDDFAEKLNAKCDGIIKDKWNSNVAPISWAEAYADFKDDIDEISEQLKAGGTE